MTSIVYLVGAGPGDPGLLTIRGNNLLKSADIVVYDSLINPKLLYKTKSDAKLIFVGKKSGYKELSQKNINKLLIKESKDGNKVVRLKGGDPFIFGRGGEEALELINSGVNVEIVPGVSSINAVPAYSGIPLTHRDFNSSFGVITGHQDPSKKKSSINWKSISQLDTIVILMSLKNISKITRKLLSEEIHPDTQAAVTSWGTYPFQKTVVGTVANISKKISKNSNITSPAVIIIGNIVGLREKINWYESKVLFGKKILVTRAADQSSEMVNILNELGAEVIEFPTIEIIKPKSWIRVDRSIKNFKKYDYVIFTSVNGVINFFSRVLHLKLDSRIFFGKKVVSIGKKTAKELNKYGLNSDIIPDEYSAEGILAKIEAKRIKNKNFLIPRAKVARDLLPKALNNLGAKVDVVNCYETVMPKTNKKLIRSIETLIKKEKIDFITFTSSSTAKNFFKVFRPSTKNLYKVKTASIGPITAETIFTETSSNPTVIAEKYTVEGLIDSLVRYYNG